MKALFWGGYRRISAYCRLIRLDKPVGVFLLLWPTLWSLWFASAGRPDWKIVLIFVLGTVLMRSAGCAINDWADRRFDGHVIRTRLRPLPAGEIAPREALWIAGVLVFLSFLLVLTLNPLAMMLSVVAALLAGTYPLTKRFFAIPQLYLGITFGFGILMAYAALMHTVPTIAWILLLANCFWTLAYDTEYAMVDREDDLKMGIQTSAITFGRFEVMTVLVCYLIFFGMMAAVGVVMGRGIIYFAGLFIAVLLVPDQYRRICQREPAACLGAFRLNSWMGAFVFSGVALDYLPCISLCIR